MCAVEMSLSKTQNPHLFSWSRIRASAKWLKCNVVSHWGSCKPHAHGRTNWRLLSVESSGALRGAEKQTKLRPAEICDDKRWSSRGPRAFTLLVCPVMLMWSQIRSALQHMLHGGRSCLESRRRSHCCVREHERHSFIMVILENVSGAV